MNYYPYQQQNNGIVWVQGEAGAKSYLVGAGQSVLLMDAEKSTFYIKSTDMSGMPQPLRVFDYTERAGQQTSHAQAAMNEYVTRDELNRRLAELKGAKDESAV
jgi:hypothetical protein